MEAATNDQVEATTDEQPMHFIQSATNTVQIEVLLRGDTTVNENTSLELLASSLANKWIASGYGIVHSVTIKDSDDFVNYRPDVLPQYRDARHGRFYSVPGLTITRPPPRPSTVLNRDANDEDADVPGRYRRNLGKTLRKQEKKRTRALALKIKADEQKERAAQISHGSTGIRQSTTLHSQQQMASLLNQDSDVDNDWGTFSVIGKVSNSQQRSKPDDPHQVRMRHSFETKGMTNRIKEIGPHAALQQKRGAVISAERRRAKVEKRRWAGTDHNADKVDLIAADLEKAFDLTSAQT